jgi:hypothetical protein
LVYIVPVLVRCTEKNLATLAGRRLRRKKAIFCCQNSNFLTHLSLGSMLKPFFSKFALNVNKNTNYCQEKAPESFEYFNKMAENGFPEHNFYATSFDLPEFILQV